MEIIKVLRVLVGFNVTSFESATKVFNGYNNKSEKNFVDDTNVRD